MAIESKQLPAEETEPKADRDTCNLPSLQSGPKGSQLCKIFPQVATLGFIFHLTVHSPVVPFGNFNLFGPLRAYLVSLHDSSCSRT